METKNHADNNETLVYRFRKPTIVSVSNEESQANPNAIMQKRSVICSDNKLIVRLKTNCAYSRPNALIFLVFRQNIIYCCTSPKINSNYFNILQGLNE